MATDTYARVRAGVVAEGMRIPHPATSLPAEIIRRTDVYGTGGLAELLLWVDERTVLRVRPDEVVAVWREAAVS